MRLACLMLVAGCAAAPPVVRVERPVAALDQRALVAAMTPANSALATCVRAASAMNPAHPESADFLRVLAPKLPPKVVFVEVSVERDGAVRDVSVSRIEDTLARLCAERVVRGVRFPAVEAPAFAFSWPLKL